MFFSESPIQFSGKQGNLKWHEEKQFFKEILFENDLYDEMFAELLEKIEREKGKTSDSSLFLRKRIL